MAGTKVLCNSALKSDNDRFKELQHDMCIAKGPWASPKLLYTYQISDSSKDNSCLNVAVIMADVYFSSKVCVSCTREVLDR